MNYDKPVEDAEPGALQDSEPGAVQDADPEAMQDDEVDDDRDETVSGGDRASPRILAESQVNLKKMVKT